MKNRIAAGLAASTAVLLALTLSACSSTSSSDQTLKDIRSQVPSAKTVSDRDLLLMVNSTCRDVKNNSSLVSIALDSMAVKPKSMSQDDAGTATRVGMKDLCPDQWNDLANLIGHKS